MSEVADYAIRPLQNSYSIDNERYYSLGYSKQSQQYFLRKATTASIVEIYTTDTQWIVHAEDREFPIKETELGELTYFFSIDTKNNEIVNYDPQYLIKNLSSSIPDWSTHTNIPFLCIGLGRDIHATYGRYDHLSDSFFRSCFKHECIWLEVIYPIHVFNSDGIFLTLLNSKRHTTSANNVKSLPKVLATKRNSMIVVNDRQKLNVIYLGGSTTYVADASALEYLKLILFEYIYKNSHITKKYNYVSFSVNHQKSIYKFDRVHATKLNAQVLNSVNSGIPINLNSTFKGLAITNSSKTQELNNKLEKWLDKFNLYTDELTVSNYLVEVKDDFLIKVAHYLSVNLTTLSQL
jgi:hypothetical protein